MGSCTTKTKTQTSTIVQLIQPIKIKEINQTNETKESSCNSFPDPYRHTIFGHYLNSAPQIIREYDPNYIGTQYNVLVNGVLFSAISSPDHIMHPQQFLNEEILEENE